MSKLKRQEVKPPVYLLNDGLFFAIDRTVMESPVYFRQKDAETYFDNPFLIRDHVFFGFNWVIQYRWFSPRYIPSRFDYRFLKPYTNEELINMFGLQSDFLSKEAKIFDDLDFSWEQKPFPTPSKSIQELELEYLKARSDYVNSCKPTKK